MKRVLGLAALSALAFVARADENIVTDRPDFVESSDVVGKGRVQIETSWAVERSRDGAAKERTSSTPTLLRFGVSDALELRVETDGRQRYRLDDADGAVRQRGWADTAVGVKWHLRDGDEGRPALAVLLHADLDSGSAAFRGNGVRPSLRGVAEWDLPAGMSVGIMPGLIRERVDDGRHAVNGMFGVTLGKEWTERFHTLVEVAAPRIARARNGGTQATFDVGGGWLVNRDCQLDAMVSRGLNSRTADWFFTVGLSFRL